MLDIKELEKLYKKFCKQPMTDYCIINNGKKIYTDTGHALEGVELFMNFVKAHKDDIDIIAIPCGKGTL